MYKIRIRNSRYENEYQAQLLQRRSVLWGFIVYWEQINFVRGSFRLISLCTYRWKVKYSVTEVETI
jgi:hypothetical protein